MPSSALAVSGGAAGLSAAWLGRHFLQLAQFFHPHFVSQVASSFLMHHSLHSPFGSGLVGLVGRRWGVGRLPLSMVGVAVSPSL